MAFKWVLPFLTVAYLMASYSTSSAREMAAMKPETFNLSTDQEIGGVFDCWKALSEIKSCANEITAFFANGVTDIGPLCCQAITEITHQCWPALLTTLGFTLEETNVLRGYCDAAASSSSAVPVPSPLVQPSN